MVVRLGRRRLGLFSPRDPLERSLLDELAARSSRDNHPSDVLEQHGAVHIGAKIDFWVIWPFKRNSALIVVREPTPR